MANTNGTPIFFNTILNPHKGEERVVEMLRIKGRNWTNPCEVALDETAAPGYQCRYFMERGPFESLGFLLEVTGNWYYDFNTGEWNAACRIVVPTPDKGAAMMESFTGKVWCREV